MDSVIAGFQDDFALVMLAKDHRPGRGSRRDLKLGASGAAFHMRFVGEQAFAYGDRIKVECRPGSPASERWGRARCGKECSRQSPIQAFAIEISSVSKFTVTVTT